MDHATTIGGVIAVFPTLIVVYGAWQATSGWLAVASPLFLLLYFPLTILFSSAIGLFSFFVGTLFHGVKTRNVAEIICSVWFLLGIVSYLLSLRGSV